MKTLKPISEIESELQKKFGRKELGFGLILQRKKPIERKLGLGTRCYWRFVVTRKIHLISEGIHYVDWQISSIDDDYGMNVCNESFSENIPDDEEEIKKKFKIIGHPLALSDVLKAMGEKYRISGSGWFIIGGFAKFRWNLSHNLLRDQKEETVREIHKLLNP